MVMKMADFSGLTIWTDAYLGDTQHLTLQEHGAYLKLLMIAWRSPGCCLPSDDKRLATMLGITIKAWRSIKPEVLGFWELRDGAYFQGRLTREREKVESQSKKSSAAAKRKWAVERLKSKGDVPEVVKKVGPPFDSSHSRREHEGEGKLLKTNDTECADASLGHMPQRCTPSPSPSLPLERPSDSCAKAGKTAPVKKTKSQPMPERFEEFWNQYPHRGGAKKGKSLSLSKYIAALKAGATEDEIIRGAMRYGLDRQVVDGFVKNPSNWLRDKGWKDEIEPRNTTGPNSSQGGAGGGFPNGARGAHAALIAGLAENADNYRRGEGRDIGDDGLPY